MKRKISGIFVIKLLFFSSVLAGAQESLEHSGKERKKIAAEQIKKLREGVLVVRLPSNQRKIDALQALIDGGELNEKDQQRMEGQLNETIENTRKANKRIITGFNQHYNYSEVVFMLDTAVHALKRGQHTDIFLNDSLVLDPAIKLKGRDFFILRFGKLSQENSTGFQAIILSDANFKDLYKPLPYFVRINRLGSIIGTILPRPEQAQRNVDKIVIKLNKNLRRFYHKAHGA